MRVHLIRHPDFPCEAVRAVAVDVSYAGASALAVRYVVEGDIDAVALPPPAPPVRTDDLWRHTCLEAFAADAAGRGYTEYNLAPSTAWAAYRFDGYRRGMRAAEIAPPAIEVDRSGGRLELRARLELAEATGLLSLAAVIEETSGRISYWAVRHPAGSRPDFHHADGFAVELPAVSAP
ncbi:MAG: DOMON-like domain-containing protein [Phenylobacterium sp.]|uniref:DOMON-like domain-containing protein n=1 Tax=Phenylobacterium sp. TaxID=1871053 RepID=UPI001A547B7C|nr:DOMON-like domain-containing protein [Phenylobacterium sp.]MBL8553526.1 DOMON-like domain-containing protein [Phenylobacterium sp.]